MSDATVLVADAPRLPALRATGPIKGSVLYFSEMNLPNALEAIRADAPKAIALEAGFYDSATGKAFVERLQRMDLPSTELQLLARVNGAWTTTPLETSRASAADADAAELNTRRAPRYKVVSPPAQTQIDGKDSSLVDVSAVGAQVISDPVLRPKQRIKVTITEDQAVLQFVARVAWSVYEKLKDKPTAHYRAGLEFDDSTRAAIEDFCKRHCAEEPLPYRK